MESLALMVAVIWLFVCLSGPLAFLFDYLRLPIPAGLFSVAAIFLGSFWFAHVSTWPKYIGLVSGGLGLYVLWRTAKRF